MSTTEILVAEEQRLLSLAAQRHEASHTRTPECNLVKQHCDGLYHKAAESDPVRSEHFMMPISHRMEPSKVGTAYLESA